MREIKNLAATMNGENHGKPALDEYQRRWVDWRTELAAGSLHYAPDSPLQFLMCFLKYVLSIVVMQYILARMARR